MLMKIEKLIGLDDTELGDEDLNRLLKHARRRLGSALTRIRRPEAAVGMVKSPLGDLLVAMTARGIVLNHYFVDDVDLARTIEKVRLELDLVEDPRAVKEVGVEIHRHLAGQRAAAEDRFEPRRHCIPTESFAQAPGHSARRRNQLSSFGRRSGSADGSQSGRQRDAQQSRADLRPMSSRDCRGWPDRRLRRR